MLESSMQFDTLLMYRWCLIFVLQSKTYSFDRVFNSSTTQEQVYMAGAKPIVKGKQL